MQRCLKCKNCLGRGVVGLQTLVGLARSALISLGEVTLYLLKLSGYPLMFSAQYLLLFHLQILC